MQLRGEWVDDDGSRHRDALLHAWGEWEPESEIVPDFVRRSNHPHAPRFLWRPYWVRKNSYRDLHNTDPFIFGDHFLYSNCGQAAASKAGLKRLGDGSVIAFGSGKRIGDEWMYVLDTVLVVRDSILYDPCNPRKALEGKVPETFLAVTGGPLSEDPNLAKKPIEERTHRLYWGATPDDPLDGMYSFFPAIPAGNASCFRRPVVCLDRRYVNSCNWQVPKGTTRNLPTDELRRLWALLVEQVRGAGLVIGTHAQLPEHRER